VKGEGCTQDTVCCSMLAKKLPDSFLFVTTATNVWQ